MKKIKIYILASVSILLILELVCSQIDLEYYYYKNDINLEEKYRHFYEKNGIVNLKRVFVGTLKTQPFTIKKSQNEIRIMFFGGSSVYNLTFENLRRNLTKKWPSKKLTLINLGGNAYGTTRVLLLMKELLIYDPDLIILYTGHNEFEEKFINEKIKSIDNFHGIKSKHDNTFATIRAASYFSDFVITSIGKTLVEEKARGSDSKLPQFKKIKWGVRYNKDKVYLNYKLNLTSMIKLTKKKNTPLLMNTVAFNRETAPYLKDDIEIISNFESCFNINKIREKYNCLENALELNLEPHRASLKGNLILKRLARQNNLKILDIDSMIKEYLINKKLSYAYAFYDHCHLNPGYNLKFLEDVWSKEIFNYLDKKIML